MKKLMTRPRCRASRLRAGRACPTAPPPRPPRRPPLPPSSAGRGLRWVRSRAFTGPSASRLGRLDRLWSDARHYRHIGELWLEPLCGLVDISARLLQDVADLVGLGLFDDRLLGRVRRRLLAGRALSLALLLTALRL